MRKCRAIENKIVAFVIQVTKAPSNFIQIDISSIILKWVYLTVLRSLIIILEIYISEKILKWYKFACMHIIEYEIFMNHNNNYWENRNKYIESKTLERNVNV